MLPLLMTAGMCVAVSDGIDWSQASDDLRLASLKPVKTLNEVQRLTAGRKIEMIGCGVGVNEFGHSVGFYSNGYSLKPTGTLHKVYVSVDWHGADSKVAGSLGMVVCVEMDNVSLRRNRAGLFVAQPGVWSGPLLRAARSVFKP